MTELNIRSYRNMRLSDAIAILDRTILELDDIIANRLYCNYDDGFRIKRQIKSLRQKRTTLLQG